MKYAIAYDIVDDKRRRHVVKILLGVGYRVQKSVFEGFLSSDELTQITAKLANMINIKEDSVRFYPLCESCNKKVGVIGVGVMIEKIDYIIV